VHASTGDATESHLFSGDMKYGASNMIVMITQLFIFGECGHHIHLYLY